MFLIKEYKFMKEKDRLKKKDVKIKEQRKNEWLEIKNFDYFIITVLYYSTWLYSQTSSSVYSRIDQAYSKKNKRDSQSADASLASSITVFIG